jgi:uncharacterized membrane-anchored protein YhcB (DUF1043 family)
MESAINLLSQYRRPEQLLRNLFAIFNLEGGRRDFLDPVRYERLYFAATRINWFKDREALKKETWKKITKLRRLTDQLGPYKKRIDDKKAELFSEIATGGNSMNFDFDHDYDDMLEEIEDLAYDLDSIFTQPVEHISVSAKKEEEQADDKKGFDRPEKIRDYKNASRKDFTKEVVI